MKKIEQRLSTSLEKRERNHLLRKLKIRNNGIDFSSNDYLGLAKTYVDLKNLSGSGGSRLISGNHSIHEELETRLSHFYKGESSLLFNSGFDANLSILSSIPQKNDIVLYDALVHNSIRQGIRLSNAKSYKFDHSNLEKLEDLLSKFNGDQVFIVVESVYSMDGDKCDLIRIVELADKYDSAIILDEAHSNGIMGENGEGMAVEFDIENRIFARMMGFGKALGRHGAVVVGSESLIQYLINFASSIIYSTALPPSSIGEINHAFDLMEQQPDRRAKLWENIKYFQQNSRSLQQVVSTDSPIQMVKIPGNEEVRNKANELNEIGININPILSPTVSVGSERLRVCLHSFNTRKEIDFLLNSL